jgi:hypothetical protein
MHPSDIHMHAWTTNTNGLYVTYSSGKKIHPTCPVTEEEKVIAKGDFHFFYFISLFQKKNTN